MNGPSQYTQWLCHLQPTKAGPKALAGFIDAPENGPPTRILAPTINAIASGAIVPNVPRLWSIAVAKTV
ncbi:hypothetical protein Tco_1085106 [Tanacetum coccineum]